MQTEQDMWLLPGIAWNPEMEAGPPVLCWTEDRPALYCLGHIVLGAPWPCTWPFPVPSGGFHVAQMWARITNPRKGTKWGGYQQRLHGHLNTLPLSPPFVLGMVLW